MKDKILFVDDNEQMLNTYKYSLRKDFAIDIASGADQALAVLKENGPYSVVISDYHMPGVNGIEFLSQIKKLTPDTTRIIITGYADLQTAIEAVNKGSIFRFLTKPCDLDDLIDTIFDGVDQHNMCIAQKKLVEAEKKQAKLILELEKTNETLKKSQAELVQSEKMAALGQLVAGVAHEINNPVGISVTAASTFDKITKKIILAYDNKPVDLNLFDKVLKKYLNEASEISSIILSCLERTATLVKTFKQISADQTSQEKRRINLKTYLDEIILSMMPEIKKTSHKIDVKCCQELYLNTCPGALAQIITNLVLNSFRHAYDILDEGNILIDVLQDKNKTIIKFIDNGKGIEEKYIKKIFEPFFTTKRGKGGTGLGLNIVYNIVTETLKGTIVCESIIKKGTTFIIELPSLK